MPPAVVGALKVIPGKAVYPAPPEVTLTEATPPAPVVTVATAVALTPPDGAAAITTLGASVYPAPGLVIPTIHVFSDPANVYFFREVKIPRMTGVDTW